MHKRTSSNVLQYMVNSLIIAPQAEKQLNKVFALPRVEQNILLLINSLSSSGFTVNTRLIISYELGHRRNILIAVQNLIDKGYIIRLRVKKSHAFSIQLTELGNKFIAHQNKIVRLLVKNYFHSQK